MASWLLIQVNDMGMLVHMYNLYIKMPPILWTWDVIPCSWCPLIYPTLRDEFAYLICGKLTTNKICRTSFPRTVFSDFPCIGMDSSKKLQYIMGLFYFVHKWCLSHYEQNDKPYTTLKSIFYNIFSVGLNFTVN